MKYNSFEYWNSRPTPNNYSDIKDYELKYMTDFLLDADSIIDFGCGDGRTFELYKGLNVIGVDFSRKYTESAIKKAASLGLSYQHIIHNIHKEPLNIKADKGVLIKVLLHAPIEEALTIIKEMGIACGEVLIISLKDTDIKLAPHCFTHNYKELLIDLGYKVISYEDTHDQVVIRYKEK